MMMGPHAAAIKQVLTAKEKMKVPPGSESSGRRTEKERKGAHTAGVSRGRGRGTPRSDE